MCARARWTESAAAASTQCAVPVMGRSRVREPSSHKEQKTAHDPTVNSPVPLGAFINDSAVRTTHNAFQDLCERNTRRIVGIAPDALVTGVAMPAHEKATCFHSKNVPPMSLYDLGEAMHRNSKCGAAAQLVAIVLMGRYCEGTSILPTANLMHRLYVACLHVGIKAHCDQYYRVDHFAYFAGISTHELLRQELEVLRGAQWQVQVSANQMNHMVDVVTSRVLARSPPQLDWFTEAVPLFGGTARASLERSSTESSLDDAGHSLSDSEVSSHTKMPPAPALPGRGSSLDGSFATSSASSGAPSSDEGTPSSFRGNRHVKASKPPPRERDVVEL